jgi:hypothetical protein
MKNKKWAFFIIGILILFSLNAFSETKKLREVGRFRFIDTNLPAADLMKSMSEQYAQDIKIGFTLAGYGDLYFPFMEAVKQSHYEEKELAVGEVLMWMFFRSQGKIKMVQDLEWAGTEPLPVFAFSFVDSGRNYEIVMPKACGNISLLSVEPISPETAPVEPVQEQPQEQDEIRRAKIFDEIYALLSDTDLYCSFRIHDGDKPDMQIIGADRQAERYIYSDGDLMYVNKGKADGLEEGQLFLVLDIEERNRVRDEEKSFYQYGVLATKKGRARIVDMGEHKSTAVLEKCCDPVEFGAYLVPFEPEESLMGKDLGFDVPPFKADGVSGEVIYLQMDYNQIASGHWGLVNIGGADDLHRGQQLIIYRELHEGAPLQVIGNVVVIDVQEETATFKVLSSRDPVIPGDLVMLRPTR